LQNLEIAVDEQKRRSVFAFKEQRRIFRMVSGNEVQRRLLN
jgi:hypothetical protein